MHPWREIVVCVPTVRQRAAVLAATLASWERLGAAPLVELQPDDWPLGGSSSRRTAERALRRALDERPDARHILYAEDDIELAPELLTWLPALRWHDAPTALFLNGARHYPEHIQGQLAAGAPLDEGIVPVRGLRGWWGSQAVWLPRADAEAVLCWESGHTGWDIQLQHYLVGHGLPLYVVVPNPVQHRRAPTLATQTGGREHSLTFGRPSTRAGVSPPDDAGWRQHAAVTNSQA